MSFLSSGDRIHLRRLVEQHKAVHRRNALLTRAPHVGTHTTLRVKACTDEYDYADPVSSPPADDVQRAARQDLEDLAIVTDWKFTRLGCDAVVSCNPFYPKSKRCRGMASFATTAEAAAGSPPPPESGPPEQAFAFRTSSDQSFDACQPACYDSSVGRHNMVGLTSRYRFDKCRVYDPLVMAFYLDPSRRYVNPDTQILERQSYTVRDALIEPYGDAALLANIPPDYCDQYGETFKPDGREHGIDMFKCGEHAVVWSTSWLFGESLPKLAMLSYDKLFAGTDVLDHEVMRYPPSYDFLKTRAAWLDNVVAGKHRLPFPLRLSDLGIRRGTSTEWLVWTDEFSDLTDGRNDAYGGRLVERDRPVTHTVRGLNEWTAAKAALTAILRNTTAGGRIDFTGAPPTVTELMNAHGGPGKAKRQNNDVLTSSSDSTEEDVDSRNAMLRSLEIGAAEFNRILNEDLDGGEGEGSNTLVGLGAGLTYGIAYGYLSHKLGWPTVTSVLKGAFNALRRAPSYVKSAPVKTVGFWAAESASSHVLESVATRGFVNRVKTLAMVQALGPVALVVDIIALIGMAVDITFVLLNAFGSSTPISRREHFVSDRRLYRMAQAEIEFNRRLYGVGNVELTPYQYVVNTPYLRPSEDVEAHLILMPIVYAARRYNGDGGLLRPTTTDDTFEVDADGTVHYSTNDGKRSVAVNDEEHVSSAADGILQPDVSVLRSKHDRRKNDRFHVGTHGIANTDTYVHHHRHYYYYYYYFIVAFLAVFLVGFFYPTKYWTIVIALLASVLSVVFPRLSQTNGPPE